MEKLLERSEVFVSDNMWEAVADRKLRETEEEQRKEGKTLESHAAENGMTIEQLVEARKQDAKMHVERALVLNEVYKAENMKLADTDLQAELFEMAREFEVEADELLNMLKKNNALEELHFRALSRKVIDFLDSQSEAEAVAI